jgi:hypothetical protein
MVLPPREVGCGFQGSAACGLQRVAARRPATTRLSLGIANDRSVGNRPYERQHLAATWANIDAGRTQHHCIRRFEESRRFHARKRAEGKRHTQAVLALARRRVNVLWALLRWSETSVSSSTGDSCAGASKGDAKLAPTRGARRAHAQLPKRFRQALLAEHGATRLRPATKETSLVPVLRALREVRHLSLGQARSTAAGLSGGGLVGTSMEMAHPAEGLRKRSVATTLSPSPT